MLRSGVAGFVVCRWHCFLCRVWRVFEEPGWNSALGCFGIGLFCRGLVDDWDAGGGAWGDGLPDSDGSVCGGGRAVRRDNYCVGHLFIGTSGECR